MRLTQWSRRNAPRPAYVLGAGPAGLFAATALRENGYRVEIFSRKRKSEIFGTQYLHKPIPGLSMDFPLIVDYELRGTVEGYREKVYGSVEGPFKVSPESLGIEHQAWNLRAAYDRAWEEWEEFIRPCSIYSGDIINLLKEFPKAPIVSSIPAKSICVAPEHRFVSQTVWAAGDAPERDLWCPIDVADDEEIICDGTRDVGWYRTSKVFGYRSVEWPARGERRPPISGLTEIQKPIRTDCDCFAERLTRVGRYGSWTKGVLSHEAYEKALQL